MPTIPGTGRGRPTLLSHRVPGLSRLRPGLLVWIMTLALWMATPSTHAFLETDTGTFINPGVFVNIEQPFEPLTITPEMIQAGETDPIEATLRVHSTTPYTLRVYISSDSDVDLAGSTVNTSHPRLNGSPRDVFQVLVSDYTGAFNGVWVPGSIPEILTNQQPSPGTSGNVHYVRLKLVFMQDNEPYFLDAKPGTYHVTLTYEVETES